MTTGFPAFRGSNLKEFLLKRRVCVKKMEHHGKLLGPNILCWCYYPYLDQPTNSEVALELSQKRGFYQNVLSKIDWKTLQKN